MNDPGLIDGHNLPLVQHLQRPVAEREVLEDDEAGLGFAEEDLKRNHGLG